MAAGDILIRRGTPIVFGAGGTVAFDPSGTVNGAGHESAQADLGDGATARSNLFEALFYTNLQTGGVANQSVDVYIKRSNGTIVDNDTGTVDAGIAAGNEKLANLLNVGSAIVNEADETGDVVLRVEELLLNSQFVQVVIMNKSGATLSATAADTRFELTPIIYQGQS